MAVVVPRELLVTALVGGFGVALTAVVATASVLGRRIGDVRSEMSTRFEGVEGRFDGIDRRFDAVDRRFEAVESRLAGRDRRAAHHPEDR